MPANSSPSSSVIASRMDELLARAGARDRANIEKHLALLDTEGKQDHARLWRRLAGSMSALAPMPVTMASTGTTQFFIADGKFRMQVFALEDKKDGLLLIYLPDVMDRALKDKVVFKAGDHF